MLPANWANISSVDRKLSTENNFDDEFLILLPYFFRISSRFSCLSFSLKINDKVKNNCYEELKISDT